MFHIVHTNTVFALHLIVRMSNMLWFYWHVCVRLHIGGLTSWNQENLFKSDVKQYFEIKYQDIFWMARSN